MILIFEFSHRIRNISQFCSMTLNQKKNVLIPFYLPAKSLIKNPEKSHFLLSIVIQNWWLILIFKLRFFFILLFHFQYVYKHKKFVALPHKLHAPNEKVKVSSHSNNEIYQFEKKNSYYSNRPRAVLFVYKDISVDRISIRLMYRVDYILGWETNGRQRAKKEDAHHEISVTAIRTQLIAFLHSYTPFFPLNEYFIYE